MYLSWKVNSHSLYLMSRVLLKLRCEITNVTSVFLILTHSPGGCCVRKKKAKFSEQHSELPECDWIISVQVVTRHWLLLSAYL